MNNPGGKAPKHQPVAIKHYRNVVYLYCDGACKGNPGPAGCGIVLLYNEHRKNFGIYLGDGLTNNIAELEALRHGLSLIKDPSCSIVVCTDSSYVVGLMSKGWTPKANQELVQELKDYVATFPKLTFLQVPGHSYVPENEDADKIASFLARQKSDPGVLKQMEVPQVQEKNKHYSQGGKKGPYSKDPHDDNYRDPYYDNRGPREMRDPKDDEIRKFVASEMDMEDWLRDAEKPGHDW